MQEEKLSRLINAITRATLESEGGLDPLDSSFDHENDTRNEMKHEAASATMAYSRDNVFRWGDRDTKPQACQEAISSAIFCAIVSVRSKGAIAPPTAPFG